MPVGEKAILRFGPFDLDVRCGQLRKEGVRVKLQGQPVQILQLLLENAGQLVTRDQLRQYLWSTDTFVDFEHSLNTAIKRLRQALGDEAETPRFIETIPRHGYRFIADVSHGEPIQQTVPSVMDVDQKVDRIPATFADTAVAPGKKSRSLLVWRVVAISSAALVALAATMYWITKPPLMPRVVGSHALTTTGFRKSWEFQSTVVTEGTTVYFQEARSSHVATMRVSTSGGEVSELTSPMGLVTSLRDISKDGTALLFTGWDSGANRYNAFVQPLPNGTPRMVLKDTRWPTWTHDGRSIVFVRGGEQELWRANADGTNVQRLSEFPNISGVAVSPDGQHIRIADGRSGVLWETDSSTSYRSVILRGPVGPGMWSADGKYFFFLNWDGDRFNLWARSETRHWWKTNPPPRQLTIGPLSIVAPAISKDGKHIYAVGKEPHGELSAYDRTTGKFVPYLGGISACFVDFSRDGQWIAYVSYPEGTLWRGRVDGSERRQLTVLPWLVQNPRWSPDGTLIAFTDLSGGDRRRLEAQRRLYVVNADGGGPMLLRTIEGDPFDPTWSPDGKLIAYSTGGAPPWGMPAQIWLLDLNTQQSTKVPGSEGLWSPRWSPDGKYLAALGFGRLWLFNFATQKWSDLKVQAQWPNWSRDSKFLYVAQLWSSLVRVSVSDHKAEQVASIAGFPSTAVLMTLGWYGLTPDNIPITTRETGMEEVYAFDLEYK